MSNEVESQQWWNSCAHTWHYLQGKAISEEERKKVLPINLNEEEKNKSNQINIYSTPPSNHQFEFAKYYF